MPCSEFEARRKDRRGVRSRPASKCIARTTLDANRRARVPFARACDHKTPPGLQARGNLPSHSRASFAERASAHIRRGRLISFRSPKLSSILERSTFLLLRSDFVAQPERRIAFCMLEAKLNLLGAHPMNPAQLALDLRAQLASRALEVSRHGGFMLAHHARDLTQSQLLSII